MIVALLRKELRHHGLALFGFALLLAGGLTMSVAFVLDEHIGTMLTAGTAFAYYAVPLLAMFVNSRLVVLEREDRTHELLASLPIPPALITTLRYALGLLIVEAAGVASVLVVAALVTRHELVHPLWLLQVLVQVALYLFAWQSVAFFVAHVGRYRWVVWVAWMFLSEAGAAVWPSLWTSWLWHGVLVDPIVHSRLAFPWHAVPAALLWGVGGLVGALWLATWRGGALPARWFRLTPGRDKAVLVAVGSLCVVVATLVSTLEGRFGQGEGPPPIAAERARLVALAGPDRPLRRVVDDASRTLDALGAAIGVERWPEIAVLPEPGVDEPYIAMGDPTVVRVDPGMPPDELERAVVTATLAARLGGFSELDPDAAWVVRGAAAWWLGADQLVWRRAGRAHALANTAAVDPLRAVADGGMAVSEGLGWAGLEAVEERGGRDAALAVLRALMALEPGAHGVGAARVRWALRGDWIGRASGVERDERIAVWRAVMARHALEVGPGPTVWRTDDPYAVYVAHDGAPDGARLAWIALDPLQGAPVPTDVARHREAPRTRQPVALLADPRGRLAARVEWWDDAVRGWVGPPWTVLEVPP